MVQEIKQDVAVEFKVVGSEAAIKSLAEVEKKISAIQRNAATMSSTFNKAMKSAGTSELNRSLDGASKKLTGVQSQAKKAKIALRDVNGDLKSTPMSSLRTPTAVTMKDLRGSASGYGMKTAPPAPSTSGWDKVKNSIKGIQQSIPGATKSLGGLGEAFTKASSSAEKASWNFFRARAAIAAVAMVIGVLGVALNKWFTLASDYAEANHLFYTTLASSLSDVSDAEKTAELQGRDLFGNVTGEALAVTPAIKAAADEVNRFSSAMMLDPTNVKRTYATFYEMANSAGMATEKITNLSQGMTQLTYDLSSLWDTPFAQTASKLQSGISGISTAVKSYGIDISRTAADQWLLTNGFNIQYNALDRANKMIVMYNMLMEHTASAQGDLARSALQPANMLRILGEQASVAGRMMGAAVFPVLTKLIPLFIMLAQAIQRAASALSAFLGSKLGTWYSEAASQWNNYMSNLNAPFGSGMDMSGLDDVEDGLDEVGGAADDAAKAVKELNDYVMGFDELNILPSQTTSGSGGGGGGGGGGGLGGIDIPIADAYPFGDLTDTILGDAQATLDTLKRKIDEVFDPGTAEAFGRTMRRMWDAIKESVDKVYRAVKNVIDLFDEDWDWVDFLDSFAKGFEDGTRIISDFVTAILNITPALKDFLENLPIIGPVFETLFDNLDSGIGYFLGFVFAIKGALRVFKIVGKILEPAIKIIGKVGEVFKTVGSKIAGIFKPVGEGAGAVGKLGDAFAAAGGASKLGKLTKGVGKVFGPIGIALQIANGLDMIANQILPNGLATWGKVFASNDPIRTYFDEVRKYVMDGKFIDDMLGLVLWKGAFEDLQNLWKTVSDAAWQFGYDVGTAIYGVFTQIGDVFASFGETIKTAVGNTIQTAIDGAMGLARNFTDTLSNMWLNVIGFFETIKNTIFNIASGIYNNVSGFFSQLFNSANSIFWNLSSTVSNIWSQIWGTITGFASNITNSVVSGFQWAKDTIGNIWGGLTWAITHPVDAAYWAISNIINSIKNLFNFNFNMPSIRLPHFNWSTRTIGGFTFPIFGGIDWYAKGGIFDGATVAGIGEAGPEAVVPLSGARMKPFAEAVSQNINAPGSAQTMQQFNEDRFITALSQSVYNAVVNGFPDKITGEVRVGDTKIGELLEANSRRSGVGTSLIS